MEKKSFFTLLAVRKMSVARKMEEVVLKGTARRGGGQQQWGMVRWPWQGIGSHLWLIGLGQRRGTAAVSVAVVVDGSGGVRLGGYGGGPRRRGFCQFGVLASLFFLLVEHLRPVLQPVIGRK